MTQQNLFDARTALEYDNASEDERACYWTTELREQAKRGRKVLETHEVIKVRGYPHRPPEETKLGPWDRIDGMDGFSTYLILKPR